MLVFGIDMNWWQTLLVGGAMGLIVLFPLYGAIRLIKNTMERRNIKKLINSGAFLTPIDEKDYDTKVWQKHITHNPEALKNLNEKVFFKFQPEENGK